MYEKDAISQNMEQQDATFGITPEDYHNQHDQRDILMAKINSIFIQ